MRLSDIIAKDRKLDIRAAKKKGLVRAMIKDMSRRNQPAEDRTPGLNGGGDAQSNDDSTVGLL